MSAANAPTASIPVHDTVPHDHRSIREYLSWPAILAGNVVTGGFILVLLPLGLAAGLSMASPYANQGASGSSIGVMAIFWLAFVYLFSVAAGGYVAGRLRPRVNDASIDEVRFRDGMNGFVFWGLGMILSALFTYLTVASAVGTIATTAGQAAGGLAGGAGSVAAAAMPSAGPNGAPNAGATANGATDYLTDLFLRSTATQQQGQQAQPPAQTRNDSDVRSEIGRILTRGAVAGQIEEADKAYLSQLIAQRTGLSDSDARARVEATIKRADDMRASAVEQTKAAAEEARRISARAAFWTAIASLLTGFAAWYAAQLGGRHRDENRF